MVPLTQGSERSLGPWQTHEVVFATSIKKQLGVDVMHGGQLRVDFRCVVCILVRLGVQWRDCDQPPGSQSKILYLLCNYFLL